MTTPINDPRSQPMTVGDWIITLILVSIPFVNLVALIYWALSSSTNINKKNYAIATFIIMLIIIGLVVVLLFLGVLGGVMHGIRQT